MRLALATAVVCVLAATSIAQQPSTSQITHASFSGIIVKDPGGEPLKKVTVQVVSEDQREANYTAVSDAEGHFTIDDVKTGRYRVFLEKSGFFQVNKGRRSSSGATVSVNTGQSIKDIVLHMLTGAAITGRVVDEDGDPMANVEIAALRYAYLNGRRQLSPERSERTNDVGEYRMGGLSPGRYFLVATASPDFFSIGQKEMTDPAKRDSGYVPTYYPGVLDSSQAAPLELHPGDETPIDFTLVPTHTFHIRGTVVNLPRTGGIPGSDAKGAIMLTSKNMGNVFSAAEVDKNGSFDIHGVAPGSYLLIFTTSDADSSVVSRQVVDVLSSDANDVRVVPSLPGNIQGHLRLADGKNTDFGRLTVFLQSADDDSDGLVTYSAGAQNFARVRPDGSFEFKNVPAGAYRISISGATSDSHDYYLQRVVAGGREAADDLLRVGGAGVLNVDLVVSGGTGVVQGTVLDSKNQPAQQATVVALPDIPKRNRYNLYQIGETDQFGRFVLHGLRPGRYTLIAWNEVEDGAYFDPEFVKHYESNGKTMELEGGQKVEVQLPVQTGSSD